MEQQACVTDHFTMHIHVLGKKFLCLRKFYVRYKENGRKNNAVPKQGHLWNVN